MRELWHCIPQLQPTCKLQCREHIQTVFCRQRMRHLCAPFWESAQLETATSLLYATIWYQAAEREQGSQPARTETYRTTHLHNRHQWDNYNIIITIIWRTSTIQTLKAAQYSLIGTWDLLFSTCTLKAHPINESSHTAYLRGTLCQGDVEHVILNECLSLSLFNEFVEWRKERSTRSDVVKNTCNWISFALNHDMLDSRFMTGYENVTCVCVCVCASSE